MKKWLLIALVLCLAAAPLSGCGKPANRYTYDFFDTFDTWVQITAIAQSEDAFRAFAADFHAKMRGLHALFDIYNEYDGLANAKTVNDSAGERPVQVDPLLIELVLRCKRFYEPGGESVNIALGPVLALWHDARAAALEDPASAAAPAQEALEALLPLCDIGDVLIDEEKGTIFLSKEGMRLDLGAAAKGFAVEAAIREADAAGIGPYLISAGGNVAAVGGPEGGWKIGVLDPAYAQGEGDFLAILRLSGLCAVTSGDYQRYFEAEGERYGHIVDPGTLQPARRFSAVTVVGPSSCDADLLSTALFVLPLEEGRALALSMGYEAIWVTKEGALEMTQGMAALME